MSPRFPVDPRVKGKLEAAYRGERIVLNSTANKGRVRVDNEFYQTPNVLPGERVLVRMDPEDLGRVWLFTPDGLNYLGEGVCPALAGVDPMVFSAEAKCQQAQLLAEHTKPNPYRPQNKSAEEIAEGRALRAASAPSSIDPLSEYPGFAWDFWFVVGGSLAIAAIVLFLALR